MPSPRPSGLGVWKILLFPQCLHDGVFSFIIFIGYVFKPVICFLLWVSVMHNYTCNLFVFIGFCLASLTCALAWLPLPLLGRLSAVPDHMSWFLTAITDDFSFVSRLSLSLPSVILCTRFCLFFSARESGPCTSWGCIHGIWISMCRCDTLPLLLWLWSRGSEIIDSNFQVNVSFLHFEHLIVPLFVCLWILVGVYEVIHFTR
jgi:hypothetical protein